MPKSQFDRLDSPNYKLDGDEQSQIDLRSKYPNMSDRASAALLRSRTETRSGRAADLLMRIGLLSITADRSRIDLTDLSYWLMMLMLLFGSVAIAHG